MSYVYFQSRSFEIVDKKNLFIPCKRQPAGSIEL